MEWVESQINNEDVFPVKCGLFLNCAVIQMAAMTLSFAGVPFPKNYLSICRKILTRLYRVFVHVYIHHFDKMVGMGAVSISMYIFSAALPNIGNA
jgi:hypothetical protein